MPTRGVDPGKIPLTNTTPLTSASTPRWPLWRWGDWCTALHVLVSVRAKRTHQPPRAAQARSGAASGVSREEVEEAHKEKTFRSVYSRMYQAGVDDTERAVLRGVSLVAASAGTDVAAARVALDDTAGISSSNARLVGRTDCDTAAIIFTDLRALRRLRLGKSPTAK